jgi:hypothetical protein
MSNIRFLHLPGPDSGHIAEVTYAQEFEALYQQAGRQKTFQRATGKVQIHDLPAQYR